MMKGMTFPGLFLHEMTLNIKIKAASRPGKDIEFTR